MTSLASRAIEAQDVALGLLGEQTSAAAVLAGAGVTADRSEEWILRILDELRRQG